MSLINKSKNVNDYIFNLSDFVLISYNLLDKLKMKYSRQNKLLNFQKYEQKYNLFDNKIIQ